jgi:hypothetical protein
MSNKRLTTLGIILIIGILISLNSQYIYDHLVWIEPLNNIDVDWFSYISRSSNNYPYSSTMGNITILDENSVIVTFNNKNNYTIFSCSERSNFTTHIWIYFSIFDENSGKSIFNDTYTFGPNHCITWAPVWTIAEQFEFVKIVNKGDRFIAYCIDRHEEDGYPPYTQILELVDIDVNAETITWYHYGGHLLFPDIKCKHPEMIQYSFYIDWDKIDWDKFQERIIREKELLDERKQHQDKL